jgi:CHAT domain-containing protein
MKEAVDSLAPERVKANADYFVGYFSWEVKEMLELEMLDEAKNLLNVISSIQIAGSPRNTNTYQLWAEYFHKVNKLDSAEHYFSKAKNEILLFPNNYEKQLSYLVKYSKFQSDQGLQAEALQTLNSASVHIAKLKSESTKWSKDMVSLETESIRLLYKLGKLTEALDKIEELSLQIEQRLSGTVIFEDHISFIHEFYPIFELGLEIIFEHFPEKLDLAYSFIESTKAISLYKSSRLSTESQQQNKGAVLTNYRLLSSEANQYKQMQAQGDSTLETRTRLYALNARMETLKKVLVSDDTKDIIDLKKYQTSLLNKHHVLSFAGKSHYYFLKISELGASLHRRDARSIESLASRYIKKVSTFQSDHYKEAAREMGMFLEPILLSDESENLLFTGDGKLAQIPLESLVISTGDFLLMKSSIAYAPSAKIQYFLTSNESTLLPKAIVFQPAFSQENLPLKYAKKESQKIQELTKGELFFEIEANKEAFFENSENFDIIHLATHAKSIDNDPSKSYIQLSNSKLYFDEIKSLMLNAQLVCLSACETNTGKTYNGEGVQSLSRNFMAAGAKSIVSSLWEIPDNNTSEITISFYRYLKKGNEKSEALRKAKLDFIDNHPEEGRHPYNWAGLVLTGNEKAIYRKSSKVIIASASGILISALLLILSLANNLGKPQSSQA